MVNHLKKQGYKVGRYHYKGLEANSQNRVKVAEVVEMMNQDLTNPHIKSGSIGRI
ncbi:hypothetical protein [Okeania sp.]|uniref:hypothetical protein n=1 Tax=Okeania sp. TaxID=3100323 RepID=UPI002B4ADB62|nr:hypothetical protein [Okeania sp.]